MKGAIMDHRPARVYEVAFWDPSKLSRGIVRTGTWASCPDFIDARYPFTTLLHQGFIERVFISDLESNGVQIQRAKYLFGGEGSRSIVRQKLGIQIQHKDPISFVWGVMDGVVETDFPDIKVRLCKRFERGN